MLPWWVIEHYGLGKAVLVNRRLSDRGFQLFEAESEAMLCRWTSHWEDLVDSEIVPVGTSAEAEAAMTPEP